MIKIKKELFAGILYLNAIYDPNLYIEGAVKMQKIIYLLQNFLKDLNEDLKYEYKPNIFGPYSKELRVDLEMEKTSRLIEISSSEKETIFDDEDRMSIIRYDYKLNIEKISLIREIFSRYDKNTRYIFYGIRNLAFHDAKKIVGLVYKLYPEMMINSRIREEIKSIPIEDLKKLLGTFFSSIPYDLGKEIIERL